MSDTNWISFKEDLKTHRFEFVLTEFKVVKLIDVWDGEDDYYWIYQNWGGSISFSTCCGSWTPLKGVLPDDEYDRIVKSWSLNYMWFDLTIEVNKRLNYLQKYIDNFDTMTDYYSYRPNLTFDNDPNKQQYKEYKEQFIKRCQFTIDRIKESVTDDVESFQKLHPKITDKIKIF